MKRTILILDLDGVLITTPAWKTDKISSDGYSEFNMNCVNNLNKLLQKFDFEIWLSSTRRTVKTLAEFNRIFKNRNIKSAIKGFIPEYYECNTRKEEILRFVAEFEIEQFLIIDDDKSLNELDEKHKGKLILTELQKGFDSEKFQLAIKKIKREYFI